jgi:muconolactone delta-isomerase
MNTNRPNRKKEVITMLYVTNSELKGGYPLPPKEWLEIARRSMEDVVNYKKQGKVVVHVGFVGRQAGTILWDVDSHEELMQLLARLPFWPFLEWEIIPSISTEQTLKSIEQALASI